MNEKLSDKEIIKLEEISGKIENLSDKEKEELAAKNNQLLFGEKDLDFNF